jgi:hypothetical protein
MESAYEAFVVVINRSLKKEIIMLNKLLVAILASAPLLVMAGPSSNAFDHANPSHASFMQVPEIDGSSLVLGLALVGGVISLLRNKNNKK